MDGLGRRCGGELRRPRLSLRRSGGRLALMLLALAVLLQADAVVKSTVMNLLALGEPAMPTCPVGMTSAPAGSLSGMAMGAAPSRRGSVPDRGAPGSHGPCSYCAAAAHVPTLATAAPVQPSCAVAFTAFRTASVNGPRGPPAVQPRARGPPLTA